MYMCAGVCVGMCMRMCSYECKDPPCPEKGARSPESGITGNHKQLRLHAWNWSQVLGKSCMSSWPLNHSSHPFKHILQYQFIFDAKLNYKVNLFFTLYYFTNSIILRDRIHDLDKHILTFHLSKYYLKVTRSMCQCCYDTLHITHVSNVHGTPFW